LFDLSLHPTFPTVFSVFLLLADRLSLAINRRATTVVSWNLSSIDLDDFSLVIETRTVEKHGTNACRNEFSKSV
jgi:hypothetical protein